MVQIYEEEGEELLMYIKFFSWKFASLGCPLINMKNAPLK